MPTATNLVFLPWLRRGLAASIVRADQAPSGTAVPATTFAVTVETSEGDANLNLPLVGPGDIAGLDARVVVRTTPGKDESDAEFRHFVSIELDQADLPWRYTPAAATTDGQLHSWLTLVVLAEGEWSLLPATETQKLAVANVTAVAALPPLATAWACAHVQLHGNASTFGTKADLAAVLKGKPGEFVARLLCPRILSPQTRYTALLVPTYMRGRLAGLGQVVGTDVDALTLAWQSTDTSVLLPIYYQWSFQTGVMGGFKELAATLVPKPLPATVGRRNLDVSKPGFNLPNAAVAPPTGNTALPMDGALQSLQAALLPQPTLNSSWITALASFIKDAKTPVGSDTPSLVAPPLYGRWHAGKTELPTDQTPPWIYKLNSDPRRRVSAGLGTTVVATHQQQLMGSSWGQIEGLLEANAERKILQLGREAFIRVFSRHLLGGTTDSMLLNLASLQRWVLNPSSGITIQADFERSVVGSSVFSRTFARMARALGPIASYSGLRLGESQMITRLARGEVQIVPQPGVPQGMTTPAMIYRSLVPGNLRIEHVSVLTRQGNDGMLFWGILLFCGARRKLAEGAGASASWLLKALRFGLSLIRMAAETSSTILKIGLRDGSLTSPQLLAAPGNSSFTVTVNAVPNPIPAPLVPTSPDSPDAVAFRQAYAEILAARAAPGVPYVAPTAINVNSTAAALVAGLSPNLTLAQSTSARLRLDASVSWSSGDALEPAQVSPSFPQPMWEMLRDEGLSWILPGVENVPKNTVGLVVSNQAFIEAYMVGVNQEMARTLLWNGFPTDQRQTFFQQFWDSRANMGAPGALRDIKPITTWATSAALGANSARSVPPASVLLVRGDLIQRYPNAVVYAVETPATLPPASSATQVHPVFAGRLTSDIAFYGFSIPVSQIQSGAYVFVLQEQPAEPRFAGPATTPTTTPTFVLPGAVSATTAAEFAVKTFQRPVRVVLPGNTLVPNS